MKHAIKLLFLLACVSAHAAVTYVPLLANKTTGALETTSSNRIWGSIGKVFDRTPVIMDTDAEAYCASVGCVDPDERISVARFVRGLKDLNLWTNAVLLVSFSTNHQVASGSTVYSLKGPNCTVVGSPGRQSYGYTFDGTAANYLTFANPFSGTIPKISCVQAFKAIPGAASAIVSGWKPTPNESWGSYANGSQTVGADANTLVFDYSVNGTTIGAAVAGRYCGDYHCTGQRQISCNTYGPTLVTQQGNADKQFATSGSFSAIFNPNTTWEIGRSAGGGQGMNGEIAFVGLWAEQLTEAQYLMVRRLLTATLATRFAPKVNIICEGDSTTATAYGGDKSWYKYLIDDATWGAIASKRNVSAGGETLLQMRSEAATETLPYALDARYGIKTYLVLLGGLNDCITRTGAQAFADAQDIWARAKSVGMIVVACTTTPSNNYDATMNTARNNLNASIRAATGQYDYLLDLALMSEFSSAGNLTYFNADGVHYTNAGYQKVKDKFIATIPVPQ